MVGFAVYQGGEHGADPAEVNVRDADADRYSGHQHQYVFQDANPGYGAQSAGQNESRQQNDRDRHGRNAADAIVTCHFDDDSEPGDLEFEVGNHENNPHQRDRGDEILAAVSPLEE